METIGTYILDTVISAILFIVVRYGIPYVKELTAAKHFSVVTGWVEKAVSAAEQTIKGSGLGDEKKIFVISLLHKVGIVIDDTTDAMIEAAVKTLNDAASAAATNT